MSEEEKKEVKTTVEQPQWKVKGKGFTENYRSEEKALNAFETQKNKSLKKKEGFKVILSYRANSQSEWTVIDEIQRSASFYEED